MPIGFNRQPDERPAFEGLRLIPESEDPLGQHKGKPVEFWSEDLRITGEYVGTTISGAIIFREHVINNGDATYRSVENGVIKPTGSFILRPAEGSVRDAEARYASSQRQSNQVSDS
ncbi:hypothetical protein CO038_03510 [Candidatus Pacearchaeota archaeon CG_4_9_14_0_2_um_filter_39_13]|nr:hypothetical protein [Candidatus Pacearchaeota archaeon]OIO43603.1 MAG: hypothetical protein AUJ64_01995 [Candidatus Pacearchaeota archaeon CG1_02_39_14]PJC44485.1 MAG: hypothetical protein CO038_03510 [Candidatus Pacearchaeota archaeon CG_4_9_14_0_2_um_filter_39_13]